MTAVSVAEARTHVVSSGETIASIARETGVDAAALAKLNQLEGPDVAVRAGQVLALDAAGTDEMPVSDSAVAAARARPAAAEAAQPTAGADLAMWNAAPTPEEVAAATETAPAAQPRLKGLVRATAPLQRFAGGIVERGVSIASSLTRSALRFLGTPYSFGGTTAVGFDCSGYVQHVFAMMGVHLPRTADAQYVAGRHIPGGAMKTGDLVFFQTYERGPSHVGIYLGSGKFVHASSSHGVTVSSLHESYWAARYLGAKRVVD